MIRLERVSKYFRRNAVLREVSLEAAAGDRIALVGSNGAGKTTLIRCLLGEYRCEGAVSIGGLDPRTQRTEVLGRIGFVPQLPPPLRMPVGQLVNYAASLCGSDPARMVEIAQTLGLDARSVWRQAFFKLSGGQKQKLLISIALGRPCALLVLDEPAANLDPVARHAFFALLAERQDRSAMLISSHRLDEVAALVNRVVELDQGQIVLDDHVADQISIGSMLLCTIRLTRAHAAFAETARDWGLSDLGEGRLWSGVVAGPDRLRFLGMLSRYAGLLKGIALDDDPNAMNACASNVEPVYAQS
ncbi:MAG: ABC transporter ATP-binding protein [Thiotrichales bacterium]